MGRNTIANKYKCVFCGNTFTGFGYNAMPVKQGRCCVECHGKYVFVARRELGAFVNSVKAGDIVQSPKGWRDYVFSVGDDVLPMQLRGHIYLALSDVDSKAVEVGAAVYGERLRLLSDIDLRGYTILGHYYSPNYPDGSAQAGREWYANNSGDASYRDGVRYR